jgi:hypothetical protein
MSENKHDVSNPLQACNDIFIRPSEVFKALSLKDNWSWVPFILVAVISALPSYLYFGVVDYSWYVDGQLAMVMPDASPAELENMRPAYGSGESAALFALFGTPLGLIIISAIMGLYYTLVTRNDDKSIHSFFDWYGAQWWFMMPTLIASVISLGLILLMEPGSQVSQSVLSPTSVAYIFSIEQSSKWFGFMSSLRIDSIWVIYLGAICLQQWTNFSRKKSIIIAALPTVIILCATLLWTISQLN